MYWKLYFHDNIPDGLRWLPRIPCEIFKGWNSVAEAAACNNRTLTSRKRNKLIKTNESFHMDIFEKCFTPDLKRNMYVYGGKQSN